MPDKAVIWLGSSRGAHAATATSQPPTRNIFRDRGFSKEELENLLVMSAARSEEILSLVLGFERVKSVAEQTRRLTPARRSGA